jgi:hypothetical protein
VECSLASRGFATEYGKVILDTYSTTEPGAVVSDHWLHGSMFTSRLCHVDIGFAMEAKAPGITATTNREGFHRGDCHEKGASAKARPSG